MPNLNQIVLIDDTLFPQIPEYHNIGYVCFKGHHEMQLIPQYRLHIIELPKAAKNEELDINNPLHRFILFFNPYTSAETMKKIIKMDEAIKMANEKLISLLKSQEEEHYKLLDRMAELDHNTFIADAKNEGREEGREEEKIKLALILLNDNVPLLKISEYTGLSIEKIQSLRYGK